MFTLVLDLDETLIHFIDSEIYSAKKKAENLGNQGNLTARSIKSKSSFKSNEKIEDEEFGGHFLIRPGAREFLEKMSKHFEVVIFTAAM